MPAEERRQVMEYCTKNTHYTIIHEIGCAEQMTDASGLLVISALCMPTCSAIGLTYINTSTCACTYMYKGTVVQYVYSCSCSTTSH